MHHQVLSKAAGHMYILIVEECLKQCSLENTYQLEIQLNLQSHLETIMHLGRAKCSYFNK